VSAGVSASHLSRRILNRCGRRALWVIQVECREAERGAVPNQLTTKTKIKINNRDYFLITSEFGCDSNDTLSPSIIKDFVFL
jgi:hypothetical protein